MSWPMNGVLISGNVLINILGTGQWDLSSKTLSHMKPKIFLLLSDYLNFPSFSTVSTSAQQPYLQQLRAVPGAPPTVAGRIQQRTGRVPVGRAATGESGGWRVLTLRLLIFILYFKVSKHHFQRVSVDSATQHATSLSRIITFHAFFCAHSQWSLERRRLNIFHYSKKKRISNTDVYPLQMEVRSHPRWGQSPASSSLQNPGSFAEKWSLIFRPILIR